MLKTLNIWNILNFALLVCEIFVLTKYIVSLCRRKEINHFIMLLEAFIINFAMHLIPYLYYRSLHFTPFGSNGIYDIFECLSCAVRNFVGEVTTSNVVIYGNSFSEFSYIYSIGTLIAMGIATSTILSFFSHKMVNGIRVHNKMHSETCNIIVGSEEFSRDFAKKNKNSVILLHNNTDKSIADSLIENKYAVITLNEMSVAFWNSKHFNKKTRYNLICECSGDEFLDYINEFISYKKENPKSSKAFLYIEIDESKMGIISEEIVVNSGCAEYITLFSTNELIARTLVDEYTMAKYIPRDFLNPDTSLKNDVDVRVFMIGYNNLSKEIYKQFLLSNHFVTYDNKYHPFPVKYHIYAENINEKDSNIHGIPDTLSALQQNDYLPFPELAYKTLCRNFVPHTRIEMMKLADIIKSEGNKTFNYIVIDLDDAYQNIEFAIELDKLIKNTDNSKIFVNSKAALSQNHPGMVSYGETEKIMTEEVIVNDNIQSVAKAIHESYTDLHTKQNAKKSDSKENNNTTTWGNVPYHDIKSNICAAMGLRFKLNLLGLDCIDDDKKNNIELIAQRYPYKLGGDTFDTYHIQNLQNALRAQEHSRWTAFYLMSMWLPIPKDEITVESLGDGDLDIHTKDGFEKKHACITTEEGLFSLSSHIAELVSKETGRKVAAREYEYFSNDDLVLIKSPEILSELGYSIIDMTGLDN